MPATLTSSSGVVTIDLNANPSDFYRLSTTENVTSWVITGDTDGDGFILRVTRNTGHTVGWTGLADVWTNGLPSISVGQTIYFPMVLDGSNWIGETTNVSASSPALTLQSIAHSATGAMAVNANNGHTVEATLTANITSHTITNQDNGQVLALYYKASGGSRTVDFSGLTAVQPFTNPGSVVLTSGQVYRATIIRQFDVTYLLDAERVT